MLIPHGMIVVLADSRDWRVLRNTGTEAAPVLMAQDTPALAEAHHAGGHGGAHATEAAHAGAIGAWIDRQAQAHRLEQWVLIAPPRMLGELRRHLGHAATQALIGTLAKDLIAHGEAEVLAALRGM